MSKDLRTFLADLDKAGQFDPAQELNHGSAEPARSHHSDS